MEEKNQLAKREVKALSTFANQEGFEQAQRMAIALSKSNIIPSAYQNNVPNTLVALEMAGRIGISPLMVMQNLDVIKGKPSWSSSFIISALNSCGRFKPIRWEVVGNEPKKEDYKVRAITKSLEDGQDLKGPWITWEMAKAENWVSKPGSKWKTMPELMFQYRSAAFFGRLYAPDILKGMHSVEEIIDIATDGFKEGLNEEKFNELDELFKTNEFDISEHDSMNIQRIIDEKETASFDKAIRLLNQNIKS
jgi:hypothetical protein